MCYNFHRTLKKQGVATGVINVGGWLVGMVRLSFVEVKLEKEIDCPYGIGNSLSGEHG